LQTKLPNPTTIPATTAIGKITNNYDISLALHLYNTLSPNPGTWKYNKTSDFD